MRIGRGRFLLETDHLVTTIGLRSIQCLVSAVQEVGGRVVFVRYRCHKPNAHSHDASTNVRGEMRDRHTANAVQNGFKNNLCPCPVCVWKYDDKLLTAEAGDEITGALQARLYGLSHCLEAIVASQMSMLVVKLLEAIDIDHSKGKQRLSSVMLLPFLLKRAVETPSVGDSSQSVRRSLKLQ
ncbi:MAG: hypothetical protein SGI77_22460 [Pirellulaceae bacterium]|nr:hypothetical protein [Pirellulaceae bacterium]